MPAAKAIVYREGCVLEPWLRRIALAALMAKGGSRWQAAAPQAA